MFDSSLTACYRVDWMTGAGRMRQHGVIPRTLADGVRVHAVQSGLQMENQPCTLTTRLRNAVEDTFVFMDAMGAAVSVSKSHMYASHRDLRKEMSTIQWGGRLADNRGGRLDFSFLAPARCADSFAEMVGDVTGHPVKYTREKPDSNAITVECGDGRHSGEFPIYLMVPSMIVPGHYAHSIAVKMHARTRSGKQPLGDGAARDKRPAPQQMQGVHGNSEGNLRTGPHDPSTCPGDTQTTAEGEAKACFRLIATQCMPVIYDGRSLGAHVDFTARRRGTTLSQRIDATIPVCKRIGKLAAGLGTSQHLLATKAMPGALFGCECTSVNVDKARKLRSSICTALLGPHYSNSSPEIALNATPAITLDPELRILDMRVVAMRRAIHKNIRRGPATEKCVKQLLQHYLEEGEYMAGGEEKVSDAKAAPPFASKARKGWE